jgi:hypothetical protein
MNQITRISQILSTYLFILLLTSSTGHAEQKYYDRGKLNGMRGSIEWESMLQTNGLGGWTTSNMDVWSRQGDQITVSSGQQRHTHLSQGDTTWANYELRVGATFVKGSNLQIQFRRSADGKDYYFLDFLMGWKAISVTKKERDVPGVTKLDVANYPIEYGREYDIVIAVRGESIHTYIDGQLVNRLTQDFRRRGGIALATWGKNTIVYYRDPKIRHYH